MEGIQRNVPIALCILDMLYCTHPLASMFVVYPYVFTTWTHCGNTYWKKSEHNSRSPPFLFRHRILLSAASWHGSKYSLYALLLFFVSRQAPFSILSFPAGGGVRVEFGGLGPGPVLCFGSLGWLVAAHLAVSALSKKYD